LRLTSAAIARLLVPKTTPNTEKIAKKRFIFINPPPLFERIVFCPNSPFSERRTQQFSIFYNISIIDFQPIPFFPLFEENWIETFLFFSQTWSNF
jgi:hypothetical protein